MKRLPLGIQSFRKIIEGGYVYVDKTKSIYDIITNASYYFLSRPRRFGKSLLLDTIAETFKGDKELFEGLYIYETGYDFPKHPVLRLDMSNIANETPDELKKELTIELNRYYEKEQLPAEYDSPSALFKNLIEKLSDKYGQSVVVLIDEYDKPILDRLNNLEIAEGNREVLRNFYGVLKSMDPYLRLTFITGVTKFTKTSVFSGLNNIYDITLAEEYSNICGIESSNFDIYFDEHIKKLATGGNLGNYNDIRSNILTWYDGYSWDGKTKVINPWSLLNFFQSKKFSGFWYSSGTPKFLTDIIKKRPEGFTDLSSPEMGEWALDSFDIDRIPAAPLMFQTGYLTVKEVIPTPPPAVYRLGIPNYEVRMAFNLSLITEFIEKDSNFAGSAYRKMKIALDSGDLNGFLEIVKSLFAAIPHQLHISREAYYHSLFYTIMNLLGFEIEAEVYVANGRIDGVLELESKVYVFEFKYEKCPSDATQDEKRKLFDKALDDGMRQIKDRGYANRYAGSGKEIIQAAFAFLGRDMIDMREERA